MKRMIAIVATLLLSLSLMGQENRLFHIGIDASVDCFLTSDNKIAPSGGIGGRARLGCYDQWINLVGGVRYIFGSRLSGIQVPVLLNVNLIKSRPVFAYLGAGYEFDFIGTYLGCTVFQAGLAYRQFDFRIFYKPYQGDVGAGLTFYF